MATKEEKKLDVTSLDLNSYDYFIVAFSGGKDSTACFLHLLDLGVPVSKIELWHHAIDGKEGSTLMDWPVTPDYCKQFAKAFGVRYYESWKVGGFEREMLRDNSPTAPYKFEDQDYNVVECGGEGPVGTRKKFPQVSPDLSVRWCSAYLKISVCTCALNHQTRFLGKRTLVLSGERAEESKARAGYNVFEKDYAYRDGRVKRIVHRWRPIHAWKEQEVWAIIEKYKVNPHPAYRLGWGRLSCMACIFGSKNQWASVRAIAPDHFNKIAAYEESFGVTIQRKESVKVLADKGLPYKGLQEDLVTLGLSQSYTDKVLVDAWEIPCGAFGESAGPS